MCIQFPLEVTYTCKRRTMLNAIFVVGTCHVYRICMSHDVCSPLGYSLRQVYFTIHIHMHCTVHIHAWYLKDREHKNFPPLRLIPLPSNSEVYTGKSAKVLTSLCCRTSNNFMYKFLCMYKLYTVLLTMCLSMVPYWENCSRMKEAAVDGKPKIVIQQSW
jgi:hypothetical protein